MCLALLACSGVALGDPRGVSVLYRDSTGSLIPLDALPTKSVSIGVIANDNGPCNAALEYLYLLDVPTNGIADGCIRYVRSSIPNNWIAGGTGNCPTQSQLLSHFPDEISMTWTGTVWLLRATSDPSDYVDSYATGPVIVERSDVSFSFDNPRFDYLYTREGSPQGVTPSRRVTASLRDVATTPGLTSLPNWILLFGECNPGDPGDPGDPWSPPFTPPTFDGFTITPLPEPPGPPDDFKQPFTEVLGELPDLDLTFYTSSLQQALIRWRTRLGLPHPDAWHTAPAAPSLATWSWSFTVGSMTIPVTINFSDWSSQFSLFRFLSRCFIVVLCLGHLYDNIRRT